MYSQVSNRSIATMYNSCPVYEHKTTEVQGQGPLDLNLSLCIGFFDVHFFGFQTISFY